MTSESLWGHFFKPEVRKQGEDLLSPRSASDSAFGAMALTQATDTQIEAFLRQSRPVRVTLLSESISSHVFTAACSCVSFTKGRFCKHLWAVLLLVQKSYPDFLAEKTEIEKSVQANATKATAVKAKNPEQKASAEIFKVKQAEYRKSQYQIQKQKHKELSKKKKTAAKFVPQASRPEQVCGACAYFADNGFALDESLDIDVLRNAKKRLSRVFHPDKGGTHEEILELNRNFEILSAYILDNI